MAQGLFTLKQVNQALRQGAWSGTQKTSAVDYLVVAGGGGASGYAPGGAGGLLQGNIPVAIGSALTVTVGAGGNNSPTNGGNSVFGSVTSLGGGRSGIAGGSGGGGPQGPSGNTFGLAGEGVAGQGNAGGFGRDISASYYGGGGGGAGTVGYSATSNGICGSGGAGIASVISGTVTAYAGGGGGGHAYGGNPGDGGVGGGGAGGNAVYPAPASGYNGTANTGGGGGAASYNGQGTGLVGGTGGSGIVIVSYPDTFAAAASTTGSPTVSTSGSGSVSFNGSSQYLNYAAQTPFAFGTGDFTIELWAYPTGGLAATPSYIDFRGSSVASPASVFYNDNGTLSYFVAGANRITASYSTLNAWVHLAIVRISGATKMYVNGTQVGSTYTDTNNYVVGTGGPYIGQNGAGAGYYTGYISNLRVVKGVGVYTGTFTPPTAPLTTTQSAGTNIAAITGTSTSLLLNSASGAYLADSSTNSYVATATGSPTWNQLSPIATGTGYKNRVYTWTSSGSITF